jgi:hypothetical protein
MHSPSCTDCDLRLLVNRKSTRDGLRVCAVSVPLYATAQQASPDIASGSTVVLRMYKTCCSETNITHALELAMSCRVVSCRVVQVSRKRRGRDVGVDKPNVHRVSTRHRCGREERGVAHVRADEPTTVRHALVSAVGADRLDRVAPLPRGRR